MKIVIDARMYGLEHAGIGRYVSNFVRELKNLKTKKLKDIEFYLFVRKNKLIEINKEVGDKFKLIVVDAPHYSFAEQILLPLQLIKLKPDLVHFPHFNVPIFWWGRQVVTIHDLIKHTSRGMETTTRTPWLYWFKYLGYKITFSQVVKRASKILVPSKTIKDELIKIYRLPEEKIIVTYEGVNEKFHQSPITNHQSQRILKKYGVTKPFMIYTGSLYPHKNIERLLQVVICINDSNHFNKPISLVIVCARSVFYERFKQKIKKMKAEKFVKLVGFVPDEDLVLLYQQAEAFVFPTLSEGFGLPGLEAMACGCPVVCSDIPVLREVYGEAAEYFDPLDINDMTRKIKTVCFNDLNHRNKLIKKGFEQVKKYSWQKMTRETLRTYESCFSLFRKKQSRRLEE